MSVFYANPSPTFQPAMRLVTAITNASPTVITTSFDHDYRSGDIVRIQVPDGYGMTQIDKFVGKITVTASNTFSMDIDTSLFDTFSVPSPLPWYIYSSPHVTPVGEIAENFGAAVQNVL